MQTDATIKAKCSPRVPLWRLHVEHPAMVRRHGGSSVVESFADRATGSNQLPKRVKAGQAPAVDRKVGHIPLNFSEYSLSPLFLPFTSSKHKFRLPQTCLPPPTSSRSLTSASRRSVVVRLSSLRMRCLVSWLPARSTLLTSLWPVLVLLVACT